jgi:hypothetical protein
MPMSPHRRVLGAPLRVRPASDDLGPSFYRNYFGG